MITDKKIYSFESEQFIKELDQIYEAQIENEYKNVDAH